jgi:hypothetical protein
MIRSSLLLVGALLLTACFDEPDVGAPLAGGCVAGDSDETKSVSYGLDVQPLFDRSGMEGGCGCHNSGGVGVQLSGFDMSSLPTMRRGGSTSGAKIIVPGDPCGSVLVQKLSASPAVGARMPLSGPPFWTEEERQLIHDWIAEGAKAN